MKCPKCNFDNDNDALFCEKCGTSLSFKIVERNHNWKILNNHKIKIFILGFTLLCTICFGVWMIEFGWNPIHYFCNHYMYYWYTPEKYCVVESNHKFGVTKGYFHKEIIPIQYDEINVIWFCPDHLSPCSDKHPLYFIVRLNNKWGFVNENNHILLPVIYDEIRYYDGDYLYVKQNVEDNRIYLPDCILSKLQKTIISPVVTPLSPQQTVAHSLETE